MSPGDGASGTLQRGAPYWTAFQPPEGDTRPIDPLGFDMYAERLGNHLLPGITGRTTRVRYLGMVCAGLLLTSQGLDPSAGRIASLRRNVFLPFERGWALAVVQYANGELKEYRDDSTRPALTYEFRGFRGANHVLSYFRRTKNAAHGWVHPNDYLLLRGQSAQGGLGSYLVTLDSAGFVDRRTLGVREPGHQLADAFLGEQRQRARRLSRDEEQSWDMLWNIGSGLDVRHPSPAEAAILQREIFDSGSGSLAPAVRGLGTTPMDAEVALRRLADAKDKELSSVATYALRFEPLRRAALQAFGALGRELSADGQLAVADLPDEGEVAASQAAKAAKRLGSVSPPLGLEPVQGFAARLADAGGALAVVDQILDWHHLHRAPWISREGKKFVLGRKGNFDLDLGFHGFTVPSYFSLLEDLKIAKSASA